MTRASDPPDTDTDTDTDTGSGSGVAPGSGSVVERVDRDAYQALLHYLTAVHELLDWAPADVVPPRERILGLKRASKVAGDG